MYLDVPPEWKVLLSLPYPTLTGMVMKQLSTLPYGLKYSVYEMRASWTVDFMFLYRRLEKKFFYILLDKTLV